MHVLDNLRDDYNFYFYLLPLEFYCLELFDILWLQLAKFELIFVPNLPMRFNIISFAFHYDLRKHFLLHVMLIFGIACLIQLLMLAL